MKVLTCLIVTTAVVNAITVPPSWSRTPQGKLPLPRKPPQINPRPHRPSRTTQFYKPIRSTIRPHISPLPQGDWIPVTAPTYSTLNHQTYVVHEPTTTRPKAHANINIPFSAVTGSRLHLAPKYTPRPDYHFLDSHEYRLPDDLPVKSNFESSVSEHEHPKNIPTRPIFPGDSQWAKPGIKHKPHVSTYKYNKPPKEIEEERSDGYDIFERGQERFRLAQNKFKRPNHENAKKLEAIRQASNEEDKEESVFVPQKLYAQVRKTQIQKHLPRSHINREEEDNADKLREVIKDSKIQTVYTEEGYEDSAYDHAGKEKKAESAEGHIRKGEHLESSSKKNNDQKQNQYSETKGRNRGRTKFRRIKDKNERGNIHNYDDTETYHDVKKKIEKELRDSATDETSSQAIKIPPHDRMNHQANLHTSKQQKIEIKSTMKNGDDINMEIHTEVKFINGSDRKKHKYVKIVPSYHRVVEPESNPLHTSYENEYDNSEHESHKRVKRYNREKLSKIYTRKRPNYYWKKKKTETTKITYHTAPLSIKIKTRPKRYTEDFTIDVPSIQLKNLKQTAVAKKPANQHTKFPYLKINPKILDRNSPLRYAENLDYIPKKTQDEIAFYKSRPKIECPEIPDDINPIPQRIAKMQSNEDVSEDGSESEQIKGQRLEGLGDKIDCLKIKYFGKEPLDNPFFKEGIITVDVPYVFKINNKFINKKKKQSAFSEKSELEPKKTVKRNVQSFQPIIIPDEHLNTTTNPINIQNDAVLKPPFTLQELADKLLKNVTNPNSIYNQINLLAVQDYNSNDKNTNEPSFVIVYDNQNEDQDVSHQDDLSEEEKNTTESNDRFLDSQFSTIITDLNNYSEELPYNDIINVLPENLSDYNFLTTNNNSQSKNTHSTDDNLNHDYNLPTQEALKDYRFYNQHGPNFKPSIKESFKINAESQLSSMIFDISKYLPQIKNHKVVTSEVQYKEDIKPSEQFNVYSDVLRAINMSTQEILGRNSQPITVKLRISNSTKPTVKLQHPKRKIRIKTTTVNPVVDLLKKYEVSTTRNTFTNSIKKTNTSTINMEKTSPQIFPTEAPIPIKTLPEKIRIMISQYKSPLLIKIPDSSKETGGIPGLAPPPSTVLKYRTVPILHPTNTKIILKPVTFRQPKQNLNIFYVTGMRPPTKKQIIMNYNDFNLARRSKRDLFAQNDLDAAESNQDETRVSRKPIMYTEIVRQRNPVSKTDEEEDEDDLLPRKRTFDFNSRPKTTTTEQSTDIEIEDYYELEEPAVEKPLKIEPIQYEKPTGIPEYIKIVQKINEYRLINNITTTLPEQETTTANPRTTTTTTAKTQTTAESINMGVPAFLQIISAFHDTRKQNEPESTTNEKEEIEEEDDDEESQTHVQNSNPYISSALTATHENDKEEIDPQEHIRNLSNRFRTNIDTSKYKTIERAPVVLRHNLSSRYNAEDEMLPLEKLYTTKMPAIFTTTTRNEDKEKILQREHSPEVKIDTSIENEETTISTTTKATRRRMRPRTQPTTTPSNIDTTTRSIVRRRRPQRVHVSTTTASPDITSTTIKSRRRLRQKLEPQTSIKTYVSEIPPNHKREYVPVTEIARNGELKEDYKRSNDINKSHLKKLFDRRTLNQPTMSIISRSELQGKNSKKDEIEIIGEIRHPNMKHGGNYRHIDEEQSKEVYVEDNIPPQRNQLKIQKKLHINQSDESTVSNESKNISETDDEDSSIEEEIPVHKPKIIKDPSKRMYFYAKLK